MIIRNETPKDIEAITAVTMAAFANHPFSRQTEHFIVHALRAAGAMTVSLVAEDEGQVVGHVAFSPVTLTDGSERWYGLGPIAVVPGRQKQGVGTALMHAGLRHLKDLGAKGCILVGDPDFYVRFAFRNPRDLSHEGVPPENLMVLAFDSSPIPAGQVHFHPAFAATE